MSDDLGQSSFSSGPRDRQRPLPGDPEAPFYGTGADQYGGRPPHRGYGYADPYLMTTRRSQSWVKWVLIALVILFAIPILKLVFGLLIAAVVMLSVFAGLSLAFLAVLLALALPVVAFVVGGVLLARYLMRPRHEYL